MKNLKKNYENFQNLKNKFISVSKNKRDRNLRGNLKRTKIPRIESH